MSNQKQPPNQAQAIKASKHHKTSGQKGHPASRRVDNRPHPAPPNLLQHTLENPQAARPETVLQLQRQYGNRAVGQLLAQQRANAPSGQKPVSGSSPAAIQRTIDFKFKTDVGLIAGATKPHDKLFQPIIKTFKEFKEASKKGKISKEYRLLKELKSLCTNWLDTYGGKYPDKTTDLQTLLPKVNEELTNPKFANEIKVNDALLETIMDTFGEYREAKQKKWLSAEYELLKELKQLCQQWITEDQGPPDNPKLNQVMRILAQAITGLEDAKFADQMKSDRQIEKIKAYKYNVVAHERDKLVEVRKNRNWMLADDPDAARERQKKKIEDLKKWNLTEAERMAITSYTNENYALINPAISGDEKWLEKSLNRVNKNREYARNTTDKRHRERSPNQFVELDTSPKGLEEARVENKKITKLAQSGLAKLPNWQQDQPLYRGDTFSKEEGQKLIAGNKKAYPHFVSTSQETSTPQSYADRKRSEERPVGVVWRITKSQHGKNVASLSANEGEKEILFSPNTTFQIDKVLSEKRDNRGVLREVEAHEG